ncbi:hypothetical protein QBC44DRAFT_329316 [Cladorrhinum sp. PSN332]|nr:hypothetical protein QBC44DRAFT_329316 [Cladorrhinum sp. PSN332]
MGHPGYCWKVNLIFACGCSEDTPLTHLCSPDREDCNAWISFQQTTKECKYHRGAVGLYSDEGASGHEERTVLKVEAERGQAQHTQEVSVENGVVQFEGEQQQGRWEGYYLKKRAA